MECTILLWGEWATLRNWNWTSSKPEIADMLNAMLDPDGPSGSDPQPAITEAHRIVEKLGGEVVHEEFEKHEPGLVY